MEMATTTEATPGPVIALSGTVAGMKVRAS